MVLRALAVVVAYLLAVALVPLVRKLAIHRKLLDYPDRGRRRHAVPVPRLGGITVFLSVATVASAAALLGDREHVTVLLPFIVSIAVAATILFATGLADDVWGVRPLVKLIAQSIAALVVYWAGFRLDVIMLTPSHAMTLGAFSLPVTVLWIVGLSNAFNLVDGADGLAGGVAVVALIATAISAAVVQDPTVLWCSLALLGAMLGFLRFNFPPARIFLGDSGSLVVGFLLAVLTVKGAARRDGSVYALAPIFALSYPLLDTGISMMRRWLRGEPLSRADGRHIHHQLQTLGVGPRQSVLLICGLSGVIAALGLSASFAPPEFTIAIAVAGAAILLFILVYGLRWLEYHEFFDAGASVTSAARQARTVIRDKIHARDVATLLRSAESFEELSTILEESAARFRFVHAELQGRSERRQFVEPIPVQAHGTRTWKLEYPVAGIDSTLPCLIMLSIWSATEGRGTTAGAERVAQILAPAIGQWLRAHGERDEVRALLAERFPAVCTPTRPFPALTGDFPLRDANQPRRRSSGGTTRRPSGD
jgi:UDP-GlcNAc:undecaprenyl-phosphate GlcNAc-1-phosphate transferase